MAQRSKSKEAKAPKESGVVDESKWIAIPYDESGEDTEKQIQALKSGLSDELLKSGYFVVSAKPEQTLTQILLAISAIEESVHFLEETAKRNPKYRGKLVALVNKMRPIVRGGGMTESLTKALQRG